MKNLKKFYEKDELNEWEEEFDSNWKVRKKKRESREKDYQQDRWLFGFPSHHIQNRKRKQ
jgi:hypothetical protein